MAQELLKSSDIHAVPEQACGVSCTEFVNAILPALWNILLATRAGAAVQTRLGCKSLQVLQPVVIRSVAPSPKDKPAL
jgi:hypothetical protein